MSLLARRTPDVGAFFDWLRVRRGTPLSQQPRRAFVRLSDGHFACHLCEVCAFVPRGASFMGDRAA